jgi:hypothetical protein
VRLEHPMRLGGIGEREGPIDGRAQPPLAELPE